MNIDEFLSKISFKMSYWDDYGYKQTAQLTFNGEKGKINHLVKIYPNTDENFQRILNNQIEADDKFFFIR